MRHECRICGVELADYNWTHSHRKRGNYICKDCTNERARLQYADDPEKYKKRVMEWQKNNPEKTKTNITRKNRNNGMLPMSGNKECSSYFGVYIVEGVLDMMFDDVVRMPYGNPGYDIICNRGMKVDSKAGCIMKNNNGWMFGINHNIIADYFACIAFDNRIDLNPLHMWMLPGNKVNHLSGTSISVSTLPKWKEYELPIGELISCCNTIREL